MNFSDVNLIIADAEALEQQSLEKSMHISKQLRTLQGTLETAQKNYPESKELLVFCKGSLNSLKHIQGHIENTTSQCNQQKTVSNMIQLQEAFNVHWNDTSISENSTWPLVDMVLNDVEQSKIEIFSKYIETMQKMRSELTQRLQQLQTESQSIEEYIKKTQLKLAELQNKVHANIQDLLFTQ